MAKKKTIRTIPQERTPMREQDPQERAMRVALRNNTRLCIDGIVWVVERRVSSGVQLIGTGDGALRTMSDEEFLRKFRDGTIEQLNPLVDPDGLRALNPYNRDFLSISDKSRADAADLKKELAAKSSGRRCSAAGTSSASRCARTTTCAATPRS